MKEVSHRTVPLERALSKLGIASRTETRTWILEGRLSVNGSVVQDTSLMVEPERCNFALDGTPLKIPEFRLILFHKPKGIVCTQNDPDGKPTIYDILPQELHSLQAVGRLDRYTSGLLLLTNNTRCSHFLTDPANKILRTYIAEVRGCWGANDSERALAGILEQGEKLSVNSVEILKSSGRESRLLLSLCEGKNRELRRICKALGHEIQKLKRVAYGEYVLGYLPLGEWKEVKLPSSDKFLKIEFLP
ncbi:pseudouridine synthase [Fibrobacterales bacterium]|nr:pseudouridine synthase [Fibrobacterales bacterium]